MNKKTKLDKEQFLGHVAAAAIKHNVKAAMIIYDLGDLTHNTVIHNPSADNELIEGYNTLSDQLNLYIEHCGSARNVPRTPGLGEKDPISKR